jgi:hypothetical protein
MAEMIAMNGRKECPLTLLELNIPTLIIEMVIPWSQNAMKISQQLMPSQLQPIISDYHSQQLRLVI